MRRNHHARDAGRLLMSDLVFFLAAIVTISGAIGVIALGKPFYSVLALAAHLVALAALFLLLRAEFVAFAQVVIYAGAVMVLYVFVVQYVGDDAQPLGQNPSRLATLGAFACGGALVVELFIAVLGSGLQAIGTHGAPYVAGFGSPGADRHAAADAASWPRSRSRPSCCSSPPSARSCWRAGAVASAVASRTTRR